MSITERSDKCSSLIVDLKKFMFLSEEKTTYLPQHYKCVVFVWKQLLGVREYLGTNHYHKHHEVEQIIL